MANRTDVLKLLDKPGLTGLEAARLIVGEVWRRDRGEKKILTDQEISRIKKTLAPEEAEAYNSYIELYQNSWRMIGMITGTALEAEKFLLKAIMLLQFSLMDHMTREELLATPQIVTQKQYEDLKAKQEKEALEEWTPLIIVLDSVARGLASEEVQEAWQEPDESGDILVYLTHFLEEAHPDLFRKTIQRVLELIESGQLQPVQLSPKTRKLYKQSKAKRKDSQIDPEKEEGIALKEDLEKAKQAEKYRAGLIEQEASDQTQLSLSREKIVSWLKALQNYEGNSLMSEDDRDLLEQESFIRGAQIIQAGLSLSSYDPEGAMAERGIGGLAIIQRPDPEDLDEKGHYSRDIWEDFLANSSSFLKMWGWHNSVTAPKAFEKDISDLLKKIKLDLRMYQLIRTVMEGVSEILDVDLLEDVEPGFRETNILIAQYNLTAQFMERHSFRKSVPQIQLEKLRPTEKSVEKFRKKISSSLDQSIWKTSSETLKYSSDQPEGEKSVKEAMAEDSQEMGEAFQKLVERSEA